MEEALSQDAETMAACRPGLRRIPRHLAVIPDGNRRWAEARGLPRESGYHHGLDPALRLYRSCVQLGIQELTFYGFTNDNTRRPETQRRAFQQACVEAVRRLGGFDADLLVVGNTASAMFPSELLPYTRRHRFGAGGLRVNLLVNYDWKWDLFGAREGRAGRRDPASLPIGSWDVSRIDLLSAGALDAA